MENAASIVSKFGQALVEELQEIRGVGNKIVLLRDELASMNAVLRMLAEAEEECVDHLMREWAKQVRELAADAVDCVDIYKLSLSRPLPPLPFDPGAPLNSAKHLFGRARSQFEKYNLQRNLASDIQDLLARIVIVNERRSRYGVEREPLRKSASFPLPANAVRLTNDPQQQFIGTTRQTQQQLIGLTSQVQTLAEKLRPKDADQDMKIFSIVGFGGVGKTTLAMEVCRALEADFPHQAHVSVSQAFDGGKDLEGLLKRILHQMMINRRPDNKDGKKEEDDVPGIDNMDVLKLGSTIQNLSHDKRYLILIDDLWTIAAWNTIRSVLFVDNKHGNRIIVTTRLDSVAKACSSISAPWEVGCFVHHMMPLKEEVSKQLFINIVFGPNADCPIELEHNMHQILRKCGGLPLAIVSIASLLASHQSPGSKEIWDKVSNSIGSQMETNPTLEGMTHIVMLIYSHLPDHLKCCMMYFSIFPKDYVIKKQRLLSRWIAEGLVSEKRGLTLIEVAESYFDELVARNMIIPSSISIDGRVKSCRVHDMLIEVMVSRSLEANFVSLVGGGFEETHGKYRRLSIHSSGRRTEERSVKHVRSLSTFHPQYEEPLLGRLDKFTLLGVLDLEDCKALENQHMMHVCQLFLLKFLNLNGTDISNMPVDISKLTDLQTLSLRDTCLAGLPVSVTKLENLEFLYFSSRSSGHGWRLPSGLCKMKALRVLDRAMLYDDDAGAAGEIGELMQLSKLNIWLDCSQEVRQELAHALGRIDSLGTLSIIDVGSQKGLNVLQEIACPPLLLRSMTICGEIDGMPEWFRLLAHLVKMDISCTKLSSDKILSILCKLPNLLNLILGRQSYTDDVLVASTDHRFRVLKQLSVTSDQEEEKNEQQSVTPDYEKHKSINFEQGSMAKLEKLEVGFGGWEKSLSGIEHLHSLKQVVLTGKGSNESLHRALAQLQSENDRRPLPDQFLVRWR